MRLEIKKAEQCGLYLDTFDRSGAVGKPTQLRLKRTQKQVQDQRFMTYHHIWLQTRVDSSKSSCVCLLFKETFVWNDVLNFENLTCNQVVFSEGLKIMKE